MKKKKKQKSKRPVKKTLLYRHIAFYAVLILLPVMIFIAFINNSLIRNLQKEYNKNSGQVLRQLVYYTENNLDNIETIKDYILQERYFPITTELQDIDKAQNIMRSLLKHTISNNFLDDMALYFAGDDYVYTSNTTYPLKSFTEHYLKIAPEYEDAFSERIEKSQDKEILPLGRIGEAENEVLVLYPLEFADTRASLMFLFNPTLTQSLGEDEMLLALDASGAPVFLKNIPPEFQTEIISSVLNVTPESLGERFRSAEIHLECLDENYLALSTDSGYSDWSYIYLNPIESGYSDLYALQTAFYLIVAAVLILAVILILLGVRINYRPVSHLVSLASQYNDNTGKARSRDEIEQIQSALNYLASENISLRSIVVDNEKTQWIQDVLLGKENALTEEGSENIPEMPVMQESLHAVHILAVRKGMPGTPDEDESVFDTIRSVYKEYFTAYVLYLPEENNFSVLVGLDEEELQDYEEKCRQLYESLKEALASPVLLCLGDISSDVSDIARSYHEAMMAYEYSFIKGKNTIINIDELEVFDHLDPSYPNRLFNRISFHLKNGEAEETNQALDELAAYIKEEQLSLYFAKGLCYQLIHTVSTVITELTDELKLDGSEQNYTIALTESSTVDSIIAKVRKISDVISRKINEEDSSQEDALGQAMIDYIDENYEDYNFSVQNMADDFDMPLSSLSLFFKKQNNTTVSNYLTTVRMNRAKELMLETDLPLNEITVKVGYLNTSSFIRKFKRLYGLTPGQWSRSQREDAQ